MMSCGHLKKSTDQPKFDEILLEKGKKMAKFAPIPGTTVTMALNSWSAQSALSEQGDQLLLQNVNGGTAFVRVGRGAQTAVNTDLPIPNNCSIVINKTSGASMGDNYIAAFCPSSISTLYATPGYGRD